jgi:hypothetical protein
MNALRSVQGFRQCGAVPGIQHGISRIQQEGDIHLFLPDIPDEILQRSVGRRGRSLQQLDARSDRAEKEVELPDACGQFRMIVPQQDHAFSGMAG